MKRKCWNYKIVIPIILILYTTVMLGIQFGLTNRRVIFDKLDIQGPGKVTTPRGRDEHEIDIDNKENEYSDSRQNLHQHRNIFLSSRKLHRDRQLERVLTSDKTTNSKKRAYKKVGGITVFSVYKDNRTSLDGPVIRVLALKKIKNDEILFCHFFAGEDVWLKVESNAYELCENHGRMFGGWMFSCDIPKQIYSDHVFSRFTHIVLSSSAKLEKSVKIRITSVTSYRHKETQAVLPRYMSHDVTHDAPSVGDSKSQHSSTNRYFPSFGVCVPPIFGDVSLSLLIQFIELSKLMGAFHFTFYEYSVPSSVQKLLQFYQDQGEVTIVNWRLPIEISESEIWYHGQLLAIQDCLYRNMAKFDYLVFLDLDEFVVPVHNYTWAEMVEEIVRSSPKKFNKMAGFSFKSAFFDPKQIPDPSHQLTFLQLLNRNRILSTKRSKVIVRPQRIFELGIHHVSKAMEPNLSVIDVNPGIGKIHHYRPCIINYDPEMKCYAEVVDDNILKYADELVEKYQKIIRKTIELFLPPDR